MKYIIDGSFLYGHIKGVQRYARQITKELDKYMADKPYEVEIAVPEIDSEGTSAEINSYKTHYNNIKIVILAGKSGRMWEQFTFQRYVDKQKAKPVYLCNEVSLFMKIIDNYNTHGKEIVVAGNGWQHFDVNSIDESIFDKYASRIKRHKYYLYMASLAPNKNLNWILNNAKLHPESTYVIAGESLGDRSGIEKLGNVVAIGYARDSEARALMKYCKAFLFPSTYEGFGIPPMEALCMGAEIVLGDIPVLHEIYKNAATYVNCHKPDVNIDELLEKNKVSDEAVQNVLSSHSWDRSAHIIAGIMDKYAE